MTYYPKQMDFRLGAEPSNSRSVYEIHDSSSRGEGNNTEDPSEKGIDLKWMRHALMLANEAALHHEVPVGAVLVRDNQILGEGFNQSIGLCDPTAHAEIQALRQASCLEKNYRLSQSTLYITLEPCAMCAGAIIQARIPRVVYGASDPRAGGAGSVFNILENKLLNHRCIVAKGLLETECLSVLKHFFLLRRKSV